MVIKLESDVEVKTEPGSISLGSTQPTVKPEVNNDSTIIEQLLPVTCLDNSNSSLLSTVSDSNELSTILYPSDAVEFSLPLYINQEISTSINTTPHTTNSQDIVDQPLDSIETPTISPKFGICIISAIDPMNYTYRIENDSTEISNLTQPTSSLPYDFSYPLNSPTISTNPNPKLTCSVKKFKLIKRIKLNFKLPFINNNINTNSNDTNEEFVYPDIPFKPNRKNKSDKICKNKRLPSPNPALARYDLVSDVSSSDDSSSSNIGLSSGIISNNNLNCSLIDHSISNTVDSINEPSPPVSNTINSIECVNKLTNEISTTTSTTISNNSINNSVPTFMLEQKSNCLTDQPSVANHKSSNIPPLPNKYSHLNNSVRVNNNINNNSLFENHLPLPNSFMLPPSIKLVEDFVPNLIDEPNNYLSIHNSEIQNVRRNSKDLDTTYRKQYTQAHHFNNRSYDSINSSGPNLVENNYSRPNTNNYNNYYSEINQPPQINSSSSLAFGGLTCDINSLPLLEQYKISLKFSKGNPKVNNRNCQKFAYPTIPPLTLPINNNNNSNRSIKKRSLKRKSNLCNNNIANKRATTATVKKPTPRVPILTNKSWRYQIPYHLPDGQVRCSIYPYKPKDPNEGTRLEKNRPKLKWGYVDNNSDDKEMCLGLIEGGFEFIDNNTCKPI